MSKSLRAPSRQGQITPQRKERMSEFRAFVAALIREHGTRKAVADLAGLTLSAFLRGVHAGTWSVETCLKLAEAVGELPGRVLRLAGKGDVADRIECLYGAPRAPLSAEDRALLALDSTVKHQLLQFVTALTHKKRR